MSLLLVSRTFCRHAKYLKVNVNFAVALPILCEKTVASRLRIFMFTTVGTIVFHVRLVYELKLLLAWISLLNQYLSGSGRI